MADAISNIEITFAIPVKLTRDEEIAFCDLVEKIARRNTPKGHVHWQSGVGFKPLWSDADARIFGHPGGRSGQLAGEPSFDDEVLFITTSCRERFPPESSDAE
jgi:hypothetical protein